MGLGHRIPQDQLMARSIHYQTGWRRPYPNMLLQDADTLLRVTEYDFDLSDPGFLFYCEQRGVLHCMGGPDSRRREFIADTRLGFTDLKADPILSFAQEWPPGSGQRHRYADAELETLWRIIRYDRARLQDAWELYRQDTEIMRLWVRPARRHVGDPTNEPQADMTPAEVCARSAEQLSAPLPLPDWTPTDVRARIDMAEQPKNKTKARKGADNQFDLFGF
jgi:hypothetical protein